MGGFMSRIQKLALSFSLLTISTVAVSSPRVIYGEDDRRDLFDSHNDPKLIELARSTAILVRKSDLKPEAQQFRLPKDTFGVSQGLCESEPFFEQPTPGFCSGFLVGDDLFVTAGHCITDAGMCAGVSMIFDYGYDQQGKDLSTVDADNVYYCKSIVSRAQGSGNGKDYAVVKLDRPVVGREPLKLRREGTISKGDPVTVIGHPSGLPTKITSGAKVRTNDSNLPYFVANIDSYGGNSGSAVFNTSNGEVEGILVRGETDFINRNGCMVSNKCAEGACRGEDVTKADVYARFIPAR